MNGTSSDGAPVTVSEIKIGYLTQLAGWSGFGAAAERLLRSMGLTRPDDYRRANKAEGAVAWRIAPDRILLLSQTAPDIESSDDIAILDLSQARLGLLVAGAGAAGLLARVVALDISEKAFPVGSFAQTGLHHVGVLIERRERDEFLVLVPTTWARSLTGFLADHLLAA